MQRALYFPHTDIANPVILKNALLLWDDIQTIVPRRNWIPERRSSDRLVNEAIDLIVRSRVPNAVERETAHNVVEESLNNGFISSLVQQSPARWRGRDYLIYPEKFLDPITYEGRPSVAADFNCRRISQKFSPAGTTSPFMARAMPTGSSKIRRRRCNGLN
jgi:hypothetical protein